MTFPAKSQKAVRHFNLKLDKAFSGRFHLIILFLASISLTPLVAQNQNELGLPYFRNYTQNDFRGDKNYAQSQMWSIGQNNQGIMFFGYMRGVLSYDGAAWAQTEIPQLTVRSLAIDAEDRVYVGGINTFGYLFPDSSGIMKYHSLSTQLPDTIQDFRDIWTVSATADGIYFQASDYIFRWRNEALKIWPSQKAENPNTYFWLAFDPPGRYYVLQRHVALMTIKNDTLATVKNAAPLAKMRVHAILPYPDENLLIATRANGLFLYNETGGLRAFATEVDDFLRQQGLYHATSLSNGNYALGSLNDGVVIIDAAGKYLYGLNKSTGLEDNLITFTYPGKQGGLWLALNEGITHAESPEVVSIFKETSGFQGFITAIARYQGTLYIGTSQQVYRLLPAPRQRAQIDPQRFQNVADLNSWCWAMLPLSRSLLIADENGVHIKTGENIRQLHQGRSFTLYQSQRDSNRVYVGCDNGLVSLYFRNNNWRFEARTENLTERIRTISEDAEGILWLGTDRQGVLQVEYQGEGIAQPQITRFNHEQGLPEGREVNVFIVNQRPIFATGKNVLRYDEAKNHFLPDTIFGSSFTSDKRGIFRMAASSPGNLWIGSSDNEIYNARRQNDGSYQLDNTPFRRIPHTQTNVIYPEKNGVVWLGGYDGLVRYNASVNRNYDDNFPTLINTVIAGNDSSIIRGSNWAHLSTEFEFPYTHNALTFQFGAAFYENESANQFQHFLEGFTDDWSAWSTENKINFTNLDEGDYRFRVRAQNVYGHLGEEAVFAFTIFPPWYRTWWAYLLYGILAFAAVGSVFRYRIRYLEEKAKELEGIIVERTAQIREQKDQLEEQADQLKELDKLKSRFFANISHEFRTPLTLILGPIDNLRQRFTGKDDQHELGMMQRNGRRLLNLINQLLDLSRLEDGKMILEARPDDFLGFLRGQVFSFESLAKQKKITLTYDSDATENETLEMYFDPEKLDKVFVNVLSNAFKFTPADGRISVTVNLSSATIIPGKESGTVIVRISDTGPGIEAERLPLIFERFYTVDQSFTKKQRGTGIGLALAKEFLDLHHGEISAESTVGEGTTFIVTLPLGKAHLNAEEIVDYMSPDEMVPADIAEIAPDAAEGETTATPTPTAGKDAPNLLIVEDNTDMRNYIHNHLSDLYQVSEAEDGREGLEKALATMPDLIISDVMMPRMDGYQLCNALKNDTRTSHVPVILLTAKSSSGSKIEGLELGADDYLVKPFVAKELRARVKNLIEQRQLLRQRFSKEIIQVAPSEITVTPVDERFLKKAIETVEERMADEEFSVELLSREIGMSRMQLHRKLKALTDQSPSMFIRTLRLKRAAQLLQQHSGNISEVAYDVGFNNLSYFAKAFREQFGMLPKEYEKKMGN